MLYHLTEYKQINPRLLMDLYAEGNEENAKDAMEENQNLPFETALAQAEEGFLAFLRETFFSRPGSSYWIWEEAGIYLSALRLSTIEPGFYYLEALETHPDYRRRGYAAGLLRAVIAELKKEGPFRICDCVHKKNLPSLATHLACGFTVASEAGIDYLYGGEVKDWSYGMEYRYDALASL